MSIISIDNRIFGDPALACDKFDRVHALIDYISLTTDGRKLSYRELAARWGWSSMDCVYRFVRKIRTVYMADGTPDGTLNGTPNGTQNTNNGAALRGADGTADGTPNGTADGTPNTENGVSSQLNNARVPNIDKEIRYIETDTNQAKNIHNVSVSITRKESDPADAKSKDFDDKSKDGASPKSRHVIPPTVEMVRAYCESRNNGVDPDEFVDFYTSKNWFIGKNKMVDWQSAVRTWERDPRRKSGTRKPDAKPNQFNSGVMQRSAVDYDAFAKQYDALGGL